MPALRWGRQTPPTTQGLSNPSAFIPKPGKVTAGNSSGINDGGAALILMSAAKAKKLGLKRERLNINGNGIGLGHPVGCTGARLIVTLIHVLQKKGKTLGLATLCGGGVSLATAIEMM